MAELSKELIIPVYSNQRVVFDLIAMLQDGISTVTRITSSESHSGKDQQQYGAAFGLSKAFSTLLKIDVSGSRHKAQENSTGVQKAEERVHTPASMFQALRSSLSDTKELAVVDKEYKPKIRDIIEFDAQLRRNPIIQTMDALVGLMWGEGVSPGKEELFFLSTGCSQIHGLTPSPRSTDFVVEDIEERGCGRAESPGRRSKAIGGGCTESILPGGGEEIGVFWGVGGAVFGGNHFTGQSECEF